jgi:hypothetical protein
MYGYVLFNQLLNIWNIFYIFALAYNERVELDDFFFAERPIQMIVSH